MGGWKEYEGSDEQIEEIFNAGGYVYRNDKGYESSILMAVGKRGELISELNDDNVTHYLICKKHPLADMIERWAMTGQPVYWKNKASGKWGECEQKGNWLFRPFYAPDICDYSFTPFEEEK